MLARARGYYTTSFKGCHSVTQVDPLSLTIFNMVVDAVIRHRVMVVAPTEAGVEVLVMSIRELAVYFMPAPESSHQLNWRI